LDFGFWILDYYRGGMVKSTLSFEEFDVWKLARSVTKEIYIETNQSIWSKDYGFKDQIRRASISIISNIAEGSQRGSNKEFVRFLAIAKGSAAEVRAQLYVALDLSYINPERFQQLSDQIRQIENMLGGFQKYLASHPDRP